MLYSFVMVFVMYTGNVVHATSPAVHYNQRPIRTMSECVESAKEQEERFNKIFLQNPNFLYKSVTITCERRR